MKRTTLALISLMLIACGGGETASTDTAVATPTLIELPPIDVAGAAVSEAPEFGEYKFPRAAYSLPMQAALLKGAAREPAEDLAKAGWVFIDASGNLLLTQKGENDRRFLPRDNGSLDIVPLAKKEFISVDGLGHDDKGDVTVDFTWRWLPNEVAQAFEHGPIATRYDGERKARATIYEALDGWKVLRIVEIEPPREEPKPAFE